MKLWHAIVMFLTLSLGACIAPASSGRAGDGTAMDANAIYVIRHLHKAAGEDPPLNSEGAAAALRLADILADRGITAIYATQTRRAMQTGAPLASQIGVAITPYDPRDPDALASLVAARRGPVLVVGHSNTVGDLVERFGGNTAPQLTEQDYGTLFIVDAAGDVHEYPVE